MLNTNPTVSLGDLVIVYEDYKTMKHVYVKSGGVYHNNFGSFKHDDMVGRPFGHKMASHNGHGFVHLLQPTAELWTASLSHRTQVRPALTVALTLTPTLALTLTLALAFTLTLALALALTQILYIADISMICLQLELLPGHRVIEAGTGSGSLSHGLARSVGPAGRLFTYEFNEARALAAAGEFADNKLAQVTCCHADVCAEGYVYPGIEPASIDAVSSAPPHVLGACCACAVHASATPAAQSLFICRNLALPRTTSHYLALSCTIFICRMCRGRCAHPPRR